MAQPKKLGRATDMRLAIIRGQVTSLLWNGKVETTLARAKATQSAAEKLITLAIGTYKDTEKKEKEIVNAKGVKVKKTVIVDGPKKLNARRKLLASLYHMEEIRDKKAETKKAFDDRTKNINHPLIEKIFNELAPKYDKRREEVKQGGGYTRVLKLGARKGDNAELALIELI